MAASQLGTPVNFGFEGTSGGLTETTTTVLTGKFILQSGDVSRGADEEQVKDGGGNLVNRSFYNPHKKASLEYVVTGASIAASRTNSVAPTPGSIVNISACADLPDLVDTHWIVVGEPKISGSNTTAKRISLSLESHAGITAVATAS